MKVAIFISFICHAVFLSALVFFRMPAEEPAGNNGMVVVEISGDSESASIPFENDIRGQSLMGASKNVIPTKVGIQNIKTLDSGDQRNDKDGVSRDSIMEKPPMKSEHAGFNDNPQPAPPSAQSADTGTGAGTAAGAGSPSGNPILSKIRARIERAKYYPAAAQRLKIEGRPKVSFGINEDGSLAFVSLAQSSGSQILDEAALETVRRAAPLPYYADAISTFIKFSLE